MTRIFTLANPTTEMAAPMTNATSNYQELAGIMGFLAEAISNHCANEQNDKWIGPDAIGKVRKSQTRQAHSCYKY